MIVTDTTKIKQDINNYLVKCDSSKYATIQDINTKQYYCMYGVAYAFNGKELIKLGK